MQHSHTKWTNPAASGPSTVVGQPCPIPNPKDRIALIEMPHDPHPIPPGTLGTVTRVDMRVDQIGVRWDDGSTLGLIIGVDSWRILKE